MAKKYIKPDGELEGDDIISGEETTATPPYSPDPPTTPSAITDISQEEHPYGEQEKSEDATTNQPTIQPINPFAITPETPRDYNSIIKNLQEQRAKYNQDYQNFLITREQQAQNNARMQKWGDAFKSLVDLTGGVSGAYVKGRGENPYLQQAFKEMESIPRERYAAQQGENDYLLNYWLGREKDRVQQQQFDDKMAQQQAHNEAVIAQQKAQMENANTQKGLDRQNALDVARIRKPAGNNSPKDTKPPTQTTFTIDDKNRKPVNFNLSDAAMRYVMQKGIDDGILKGTKYFKNDLGEIIEKETGYEVGKSDQSKQDIQKVLQTLISGYSPAEIATFRQRIEGLSGTTQQQQEQMPPQTQTPQAQTPQSPQPEIYYHDKYPSFNIESNEEGMFYNTRYITDLYFGGDVGDATKNNISFQLKQVISAEELDKKRKLSEEELNDLITDYFTKIKTENQ